jgi:uncharacterized membrane protein (DUF485 family)
MAGPDLAQQTFEEREQLLQPRHTDTIYAATARGRELLVPGYDGRVSLVSARQREGTAETLHRHFVSGRLSVEELADRVRLALQARDSRELRRALVGLPPAWRDGDELRRLARTARRAAVVATVTALWLLFTLVLLVAFTAGAIAHGPTTAAVLGYPAAWVVVTALAWRARRRA